ncbi:serine/threonine-protein phosphatase 2A activator-like [Diorhabda carinulata]|uniref:serine/threonine-protein phosphatase 2A activator-like n=1 Tax=Diorhabda sublineata TaxID=1163346 RepID=UPI0024E07F85|nr:serine/threonine-protein phosphatase 2A activator-like [Diorhabda sublineata]XP_057671614.1 serine/threonine-protein phosphatase 2A activator-like [Diorhabda carinulata]XP_057671623.1 serine/threonine-protein phosphatase 2A activator-like [Diorhabda carinulata]
MQNSSGNDNHSYIIPSKLIQTTDQMMFWRRSETYYEYLGFVYFINDVIKGKSNEQGSANASPEIEGLCGILDIIEDWIDEIGVDEYEPKSYHRAFRRWYRRLRDNSVPLLREIVPSIYFRALPEIMVYLIEGFGNSVRCAYGSGHEMSFLMFLCSLFKIGFLKIKDAPATACKVFARYLYVAQKLQKTYKMTSLGGNKTWNLNDYQFVAFIWGSSQLVGNTELNPTCYLKRATVKRHSSQYMFLSCIQFTNRIKIDSFNRHSNQLWNLSGVSSWYGINSSLIRMYQAQILLRYSIVKHVYFGSIFTLKRVERWASVRRPIFSLSKVHRSTINVEFLTDLSASRKTISSINGSVKSRSRNIRLESSKRIRDDKGKHVSIEHTVRDITWETEQEISSDDTKEVADKTITADTDTEQTLPTVVDDELIEIMKNETFNHTPSTDSIEKNKGEQIIVSPVTPEKNRRVKVNVDFAGA